MSGRLRPRAHRRQEGKDRWSAERFDYARELRGLGIKEFANHGLIDVVDISARSDGEPLGVLVMQKTMKAAVVQAFGRPLAIEEIPVPVPGPGEVLVKVVACGVCHTDLHAADGDWPAKPKLPFVPGHEVAGVVAALGP